MLEDLDAALHVADAGRGGARQGAVGDVVGEHVGIAFQIKDDLFDYESGNSTGKPNGTDIRDFRLTTYRDLLAIVQQDVFLFEQSGVVEGRIQGRLRPTGVLPKFVEKFEVNGIHLPHGLFGLPY